MKNSLDLICELEMLIDKYYLYSEIVLWSSSAIFLLTTIIGTLLIKENKRYIV